MENTILIRTNGEDVYTGFSVKYYENSKILEITRVVDEVVECGDMKTKKDKVFRNQKHLVTDTIEGVKHYKVYTLQGVEIIS